MLTIYHAQDAKKKRRRIREITEEKKEGKMWPAKAVGASTLHFI